MTDTIKTLTSGARIVGTQTGQAFIPPVPQDPHGDTAAYQAAQPTGPEIVAARDAAFADVLRNFKPVQAGEGAE